MKMRWVTKFNLGVKQVLIRQSGTVSNQEQPLAGKRTSLRARTGRSQQEGLGLGSGVISDTSETTGSREEERDRPSADGR